ncbi:MAG: MBG domain-containing protein, partial [Vicinamibacteria bacterium]
DPSVLGGALSFSTTAAPDSAPGQYEIVPAGLTSTNYAITFVSGTLTVEKREQSIEIAPAGPFTFGDAPVALSAQATPSGLPVSLEVISGPGSITGGLLAFSGAGTIQVRATQDGDAVYAPADAVVFAVVVHKAASIVTVTGGTFTYDGTAHGATAAATGVDGVALGPVVIDYAGSPAAPVAAGAYAVTASFAGDDNHLPSIGHATITIEAAPLSVVADDASRAVGEPDPAFTARVEGFVAGEDASVLTGALTFTTTATAASGPGTYPIVPAGVSASNYAITFVPGTLTIVECLTAEPLKVARAGSTIPVKVRTCSPSSSLTLRALGVRDAAGQLHRAEDAGNSNAGGLFRRTGDGYMFNLQTRGLRAGTYRFEYEVAGQGVTRVIPFTVR